MNIAIVGAGVAGSLLTRELQHLGHYPILIASEAIPEATRAALGVLRPGWETGAGRARVKQAIDYYAELGAAAGRGAWVTSTKAPAGRLDPGYWLVNPDRILLGPHLVADVANVASTAHGALIEFIDGSTMTADRAIIAAGPMTAHLAHTTPLPATYGWTAALPGARLDTEHPIRVHHYAPYRSIMAVQHGDHVRVGSSRHADPDRAAADAQQMLARALDAGMVHNATDVNWLQGRRAHHTQPGTWEHRGNVTLFAGLARVGLGVTPAAAADLARNLHTQPAEHQ